MRHHAKLASTVLGLVFAATLGLWAAAANAQPLTCDTATLQAAAATASVPTTIVSATPVPAGSLKIDGVTIHYPAFCNVEGYVTTTDPGPNEVNFELALPNPTSWNNKFLFFGNGGFAGSIQIPPVLGTVLGYATAATDTGHQAFDLDGSWALDNPAAQLDFASRGVHVSAVAAQSLTNSYYETTVSDRYFNGCSDGGREAMVEAQVHPGDFNGIISGDPAIGNEISGFNWNDKALFKTAKSWIPPTKLPLIDNAVMKNCDAKDGVTDDLIQDPRRCTFNPASLECPAHENARKAFKDPSCLSKQQVVALKKIYRGATTNTGVQIYPGFTESDPAGTDGWGAWITGFTKPKLPAPGNSEPWGKPPASFATAPAQWSFQDQYMKYFVFSKPKYKSLHFNINNRSELRKLRKEDKLGGGNGVNPDLSQFVDDGGKLIMYHGWSDPALTPLETVKYYNAMVNETFDGNQNNADDSARLFMVPGMHHCGGGPGPQINFLVWTLYLDGWVADGIPPNSITATTLDNSRTMPLCMYPETAHYEGTGNVDQASSWTCE